MKLNLKTLLAMANGLLVGAIIGSIAFIELNPIEIFIRVVFVLYLVLQYLNSVIEI